MQKEKNSCIKKKDKTNFKLIITCTFCTNQICTSLTLTTSFFNNLLCFCFFLNIYIYISSYNTATYQIWIFFSFIAVYLMTIFFSNGTVFPAPSTTFCNWLQYLLLLINRVTDWPDTYVGKQLRAVTFKCFLKQFRLKITVCLVKNIEFYQLHSDANIYNQETYQSKMKNSNSQKLTTTLIFLNDSFCCGHPHTLKIMPLFVNQRNATVSCINKDFPHLMISFSFWVFFA